MNVESDVDQRNRVVSRVVGFLDQAATAAWLAADEGCGGPRLPALGLGIELARDQALELLDEPRLDRQPPELSVVDQPLEMTSTDTVPTVRRLLARAERLAWSIASSTADTRCQRLHLDICDLSLEAGRSEP